MNKIIAVIIIVLITVSVVYLFDILTFYPKAIKQSEKIYGQHNTSSSDLEHKKWHVSPDNDPRASTLYPFVSWNIIQEIKIGMNYSELKDLINYVQNYNHPINTIVYSQDPGGVKYEVAIKLSEDNIVEDLSFKRK